MKITEQELLDALTTASQAPDDAQTVQELSAEHGLSTARIRRALAVCAREGRLTVHSVARHRIDGQAGQVPAYTVARAKGKK